MALGLGVFVYWIGSSFDNMCGNDRVVEVVSRENPEIKVQWIDDRHLRVSGDTLTQFHRLNEFQGVGITYD